MEGDVTQGRFGGVFWPLLFILDSIEEEWLWKMGRAY